MSIRREDALEIVRRFREAGGSRDLALMADLYAGDAIAVSPIFGEVSGRDAIVATWQTMFTTFADLMLDISDVLVDDDRLAILGHVKTTDRMGWFGLPPTGSAIEYRLVLLLTIEDGKIVRDKRIYDSSGVVDRLEKARSAIRFRAARSAATSSSLPSCRRAASPSPWATSQARVRRRRCSRRCFKG